MPELPAARLVHWAPPRARLRIDSRRRDAAWFAMVARELGACPAVAGLAVNPQTASILLTLSAPLGVAAEWARTRELFAVAALSEDEAPLGQSMKESLAPLGQLAGRASGGILTLDLLLLAAFLAMAVFQFMRGNVTPAAATLFWCALDIQRKAAKWRMADALQWTPSATGSGPGSPHRQVPGGSSPARTGTGELKTNRLKTNTLMEVDMNSEVSGEGGAAPESAGRKASVAGVGQTVKEGVVETLKGLDEIESELIGLVRSTVSNALRASGAVAGDVVDVVREVVKSALSATSEIGCDAIVATKAVAKGAILGVADVGGDLIKASGETTRAAVEVASSIGADVGGVARRAVNGVTEAASEIGANVGGMAEAAARGALEAARDLGSTALETVTQLLVGAVQGVKEIAGAVLPAARKPVEKLEAPAAS